VCSQDTTVKTRKAALRAALAEEGLGDISDFIDGLEQRISDIPVRKHAKLILNADDEDEVYADGVAARGNDSGDASEEAGLDDNDDDDDDDDDADDDEEEDGDDGGGVEDSGLDDEQSDSDDMDVFNDGTHPEMRGNGEQGAGDDMAAAAAGDDDDDDGDHDRARQRETGSDADVPVSSTAEMSAGKYVPPHKRKAAADAISSDTPAASKKPKLHADQASNTTPSPSDGAMSKRARALYGQDESEDDPKDALAPMGRDEPGGKRAATVTPAQRELMIALKKKLKGIYDQRQVSVSAHGSSSHCTVRCV